MDKLLNNFQTNKDYLLNPHEEAVIALKRHHSYTWQGKSTEYWLEGLKEEIEELEGVLDGTHDDDLIWELAQIASITMNWIDREFEKRNTSVISNQ